ncbi:hypothetical protein KY284_032350 [Solanum tuberosum]|nr:hypothetical protein KY284_032350 [Solanum tuberosum]
MSLLLIFVKQATWIGQGLLRLITSRSESLRSHMDWPGSSSANENYLKEGYGVDPRTKLLSAS